MQLNSLYKYVVFCFISAKLVCKPNVVMFKPFTAIFDYGTVFQFLEKITMVFSGKTFWQIDDIHTA